MRPPLARIGKELAFLYGRPNAAGIAGRIGGLLERWEGKLRPPEGVDPRECLRRRLRLDESACLMATSSGSPAPLPWTRCSGP